jgi:hypothetical protein
MQSIFHSLLSTLPQFPLMSGHAYLDPGSGSFLIQLLIAGLVGLAFIIKGYWGKIKKLFNRSSTPPESTEDADDTHEQQ